MKTKCFFLIIVIVLASCSGKNHKSDAYGNFETDDVIISSEANGKLLFFDVDEGEKVEADKLVGIIDTTDLILRKKQLFAQKKAISSRLENIQSQIDVQEQQKKNLLVDKKRIENLLKDGAATQKQLDDINGKLDLIEVQISSIKTQNTTVLTELEVANTQIDQIGESIRKCNIINPINGVVLEKYAEPNEITAFGKPLYKIANLNDMYLRVYVSGAQLPHIKIGEQVEVLIDENEKTNKKLTGKVCWISETAEFTPKIIQTKEERVNLVYAVKIKVKNDGSLKIGMPGEANF
ncbi:MAG: efflux RND transporter periplasmic adaptor subunit [Bacteroidetes bacterium]|nr:efflux RND transporter periplasmic adaptor subunit [Bacteroidota bacterium]MBL7103770.1 efflux RND transporter periplasmic adaptor subunit [Bacteroidales bacterium]